PLQARGAPVAAAIDAHIDALDGAPARPGQTGDVVVALVQQHLATRGRGDHALALLDTGVLAVRTIGHVVDVVHGFVLGGPLLVAHLDTTQVLDPAHALHARHHQAQRVTVLGAQHLAIHAPGHDAVVHGAFDVNGARHRRAVGTLGQH